MIVLERRHIERLAQRLLDEQGSPEAAVRMAEQLAKMAKANGQAIWLSVAAEVRTVRVQGRRENAS